MALTKEMSALLSMLLWVFVGIEASTLRRWSSQEKLLDLGFGKAVHKSPRKVMGWKHCDAQVRTNDPLTKSTTMHKRR